MPSGHSGLVLTLSSAARASLFSPCLLVVDVSIWATSPIEIVIGPVICGFYFFIFSSQLCCPLRFQNSPQTHQWDGLLVFGNFSFKTPSPGRFSVPISFVSLFIFYILFYLLSKTMGYLSGCLVSSTRVQKLFCGICSAFKWSFHEFVGEKVVSPPYSSAILGPSSKCYCIYIKKILFQTISCPMIQASFSEVPFKRHFRATTLSQQHPNLFVQQHKLFKLIFCIPDYPRL